MVLPHCIIGTTCLVAPLGINPIGAGLEGWFGVVEVGGSGLGFGLGLDFGLGFGLGLDFGLGFGLGLG